MSELETKTSRTNGNGVRQSQGLENGREQHSMVFVSSVPDSSLRSFRDEAEIHAINSALKHTGWNRKRAAQMLSISYRGLLYKIRRHNITPEGAGVLKTAADAGDVQS